MKTLREVYYSNKNSVKYKFMNTLYGLTLMLDSVAQFLTLAVEE